MNFWKYQKFLWSSDPTLVDNSVVYAAHYVCKKSQDGKLTLLPTRVSYW